jgi:tRNA dimethylallyltransferase
MRYLDVPFRPGLIFIVGPTASGKTAVAIETAEALRQRGHETEIISADSVQFYDELKIGSARPTDEELARVKHHLVGHVSVARDYTAGDFERDATDILNRHPQKTFIVVGGSGFYIQALEKGMYPTSRASENAQESIEARVDREGLEVVYAELQKRDPLTAAKIAVQDRYRIVRALEILETLPEHQTLSGLKESFEQQAKNRFPDRKVFTVGLRIERARLEPRVRHRAELMLKMGLVEEVRDLVGRGFETRPALQSVGYKEVLQFLHGELAESELLPMIVQGTCRLAKKQRTWFQRATDTVWFDAETERSEAVNGAVDRLTN